MLKNFLQYLMLNRINMEKKKLFQNISDFIFKNSWFKQTVAKNSFWLLFSEFLARVFTFLISLWVSNKLWANWFWTYTFVMSVVTFFVLIVDFGISSLTFRELSKHPDQNEKYFVNGIFLKLILSILVFIAVLIYVKVDNSVSVYSFLIFLFLWHSILTNISEFLRVFFRPSEKMEREALLKIINWFSLLIFTIIFLCISPTLQSVFLWYLSSSIVNLVFSIIYVKKYFKFKSFSIDTQFIKELLRMSIPFCLGWLFVFFYSDVNIILLKYFKWEDVVWFFSAPYKLLTYIYILFNTLSLSMFKKLVDASKNQDRFKHILNVFLKYNVLIALVFVVILILWWKWILGIYGKEFISSYTILLILSFILPFKASSYVYGNGLTSLSKEYIRLYAQIFVAVISVTLNLIFIPKYWPTGVAIVLAISEILLMLTYLFFTKKYTKKLPQNSLS